MSAKDVGALRQVLEAAAREACVPLEALTVLDKKVDPYRFDTPAGHRDGGWFGKQIRAIGLGDGQTIHLRGAHYAIAARGDVRRPDGYLYANDADCWDFVDGSASNCARWLGYVGFDQIADRRNAPPIIRIREAETPEPYRSPGCPAPGELESPG
jgi:hypothetical protein